MLTHNIKSILQPLICMEVKVLLHREVDQGLIYLASNLLQVSKIKVAAIKYGLKRWQLEEVELAAPVMQVLPEV
jgi:hypothetical protein